MCFSKEASLTAFIISSFLCAYLYKIGDATLKSLAILFAYVSLAQLIEYILWMNLSCSKENTINNDITKIIPVYLLSQPLVLLIAMYYFKSSSIKPNLLLILIFIYVLVCLKIAYDVIKSKKEVCSREINGTLFWDSIYVDFNNIKPNIINDLTKDSFIPKFSVLFYCMTLLYFLFLKNKLYSGITLLGLISTFIYNYLRNNNWYSTWCLSANLIAPLLIIIKLLKI